MDQQPLTIETSTVDGCPLVVVGGDLDASTCADLERALTDAVTEGTELVVVDLAGVPFMDSTGFGALLAAHRAGASILVRRPTDQVRRLLELVAVPGVVSIEDEATDD